MAFTDRYAITDFTPDSLVHRLSLSIDESRKKTETIIPVLFIIPDKKKDDHDHVEIHNVINFRNFLLTKGISGFYDSGFYTLEILNLTEENQFLELSLHMKENGKRREQYKLVLHQSELKKMISWLEEFSKTKPSELFEKYNSDLRCK